MVRKYVRTTSRGVNGNWTMQNMCHAIEAYNSNACSINKAAVNFGIPEATLRRYIKKSSDQFPINNGRFRPIFSIEMEKLLAEYLIELSKRFFGMTSVQLRKFAYEFAEFNNVPHNFNKELKIAGIDWLSGFLKRHKNISLRTPEMTSLGRIQGFNSPQVAIFFDLLRDLLTTHKFLPSRIFNADESGVPTVPTKIPKVFSIKGIKRVGKVVSAERGKTVTIVCSMNAVGIYIPPAFIFPRKNMRNDFMDNSPPDSVGFAHKSGWMTQEIFLDYLEHFANHTKPTIADPVLLIVDNHNSHISFSAIEFCRKHSIVMLTLPPHSTHMMQPLDVTFFSPFKTYYSQACDNWMVNHPGRPITKAQVPALVRHAYDRSATTGIARKGFQETGIWPFNPQIFSLTDFAPSITSDCTAPTYQKISNNQPGMIENQQSTLKPVINAVTTELTVLFNNNDSLLLPNANSEPKCIQSNLDINVDRTQINLNQVPKTVSPENIRPYPIASRVTNNASRKRKCKRAEVATSLPFKAAVQLATLKKQEKLIKQDLKKVFKEKKDQLKITAENKDRKKKNDKGKKRVIKISNKVCETQEISCWYCEIIYGDPNDPLLDDDWDMCKSCNHWCHLTCGQYVERKFMCIVCYSCVA
nr:uncharacterized protein LOC124806668 [Hydra vulgaris]